MYLYICRSCICDFVSDCFAFVMFLSLRAALQESPLYWRLVQRIFVFGENSLMSSLDTWISKRAVVPAAMPEIPEFEALEQSFQKAIAKLSAASPHAGGAVSTESSLQLAESSVRLAEAKTKLQECEAEVFDAEKKIAEEKKQQKSAGQSPSKLVDPKVLEQLETAKAAMTSLVVDDDLSARGDGFAMDLEVQTLKDVMGSIFVSSEKELPDPIQAGGASLESCDLFLAHETWRFLQLPGAGL